nr:hypothetical protein Q903MT_gene109 [Picea sitchensis]
MKGESPSRSPVHLCPSQLRVDSGPTTGFAAHGPHPSGLLYPIYGHDVTGKTRYKYAGFPHCSAIQQNWCSCGTGRRLSHLSPNGILPIQFIAIVK